MTTHEIEQAIQKTLLVLQCTSYNSEVMLMQVLDNQILLLKLALERE